MALRRAGKRRLIPRLRQRIRPFHSLPVPRAVPSRIWACDIYPKAVKFQKRHYGVNGIVSVPDPANFPKKRRFDFIFASSFFSHMPETSFSRWIETLYNLLTPSGILVFSVHDVSLLPPAVVVPDTGIVFVPSSESRTLDKNQYGSSLVSEEFVIRSVGNVTGDTTRLHRIRRGLVGFQDLYVLANHLNRDFSDLAFVHDPSGNFDSCEVDPDGQARLTGWAADINPGSSIKEVQFVSNDMVVETVVPDQDRPDVATFFHCPRLLRSGWTCHLRTNHVRPDDIVEIKVVNDKNHWRTIAYDTVTGMYRRGALAG